MTDEQQEDTLILVDSEDRETGSMRKLAVHEQGLLHRAFSIFVFNSKGELLLQQRAYGKYHSPGLWSNSCCSHPRVGESVDSAANRRLMQELGLKCQLEPAFSFIYRADFDNGLTEHEFDHVFIGVSDDLPNPDPLEVSDWRYIATDELDRDMENHAENYTAWHKIAWPRLKEYLLKNNDTYTSS